MTGPFFMPNVPCSFKTGGALPAQYNSWGLGIVLMPHNTYPNNICMLLELIHMVHIAFWLKLKYMSVLQSKCTKIFPKRGARLVRRSWIPLWNCRSHFWVLPMCLNSHRNEDVLVKCIWPIFILYLFFCVS